MKGLIIIFIVFFMLFGSLNYYIGLKGWQYLFQYLPLANSKIYWFMFTFISLSYIAARLGKNYWPDSIRYILTIIGSYWLGALFYLLQVLFVLGIFKFLNRAFKLIPDYLLNTANYRISVGLVILLGIAAILIYGTYNARQPKITHYELNIPKSGGELSELHLVMASDIHLGEIIHNGRLVKLVEIINSLEPDLVVFSGDVIDEDTGPFVRQDMSSSFRMIKSKLGIYAVTGNHEYIGGHIKEAVHYLTDAGVTVLRDEYTLVKDSFYLVGLDDKSHRYFENQPLKTLEQVLEGIDSSKPLILLNHEPRGLSEAQDQGIDLQLSGHTHRGQLFPGNLVTKRIYELDWGYIKKGGFQLIVSSGYGTWGPPIRIGSRPEIVDILIKFNG